MGSSYSKEEKKLLKYDFKNVKPFGFNDMEIESVVMIDAHDGDTIKIGFFYRKLDIVLNLRLECCDAPEINHQNELHRKCAIKSRDFLEKQLHKKILKVKFSKHNDKYGRALGKIYCNNICINDLMIEKGYAKPYNGKKKIEFTENELNHIYKLKD